MGLVRISLFLKGFMILVAITIIFTSIKYIYSSYPPVSSIRDNDAYIMRSLTANTLNDVEQQNLVIYNNIMIADRQNASNKSAISAIMFVRATNNDDKLIMFLADNNYIIRTASIWSNLPLDKNITECNKQISMALGRNIKAIYKQRGVLYNEKIDYYKDIRPVYNIKRWLNKKSIIVGDKIDIPNEVYKIAIESGNRKGHGYSIWFCWFVDKNDRIISKIMMGS